MIAERWLLRRRKKNDHTFRVVIATYNFRLYGAYYEQHVGSYVRLPLSCWIANYRSREGSTTSTSGVLHRSSQRKSEVVDPSRLPYLTLALHTRQRNNTHKQCCRVAIAQHRLSAIECKAHKR